MYVPKSPFVILEIIYIYIYIYKLNWVGGSEIRTAVVVERPRGAGGCFIYTYIHIYIRLGLRDIQVPFLVSQKGSIAAFRGGAPREASRAYCAILQFTPQWAT